MVPGESRGFPERLCSVRWMEQSELGRGGAEYMVHLGSENGGGDWRGGYSQVSRSPGMPKEGLFFVLQVMGSH